ncbi:MAG TPA: pyridoxal 5'-phosphate synthase glutaminase subunit PdxT [Anaerolineaceae bacterium]|nr:pyridoxal 5'-phosphate synthase glutaminase subunit PdxT [Anaerolineaceae bacterium]
MKIGVLALQGSFYEHQQMLQNLGVQVVQVRLPHELEGLDGLIIPGGESTTIGKLAVDFGLLEPLQRFGKEHAIWGTCAGSIFLSKDAHRQQPLLGLMDIQVERNAFGRQVDSFEIDLEIPVLRSVNHAKPIFHGIFIRAPLIEKAAEGVEILARLPNDKIVAARQGHLLATSFHPELTDDTRFHQYFLEVVP